MTPQQAVGLAGRLFAIWLALGSFQSWAVVRALRSQGVLEAAWVQWSVPAVYWLGAVVLWFFPMSIAHRLLPRTRYEDRIALPAHQAVVVACIVLGFAVVLLRALPALTQWLAVAMLWMGNGRLLSTLDASSHVDLLVGGLQLVAGLFFVFRAHAIADRLLPPAPRESVFAVSVAGDSSP